MKTIEKQGTGMTNYIEVLKHGYMKAIQKQGTGVVKYIETPIPGCGPNDLLLKPLYSGICATDLHVLYHDLGQEKRNAPLIMGHEFSATVVEIGENVNFYVESNNPIKVGDRVTVEPVLHCRKCTYCLQGKINLCPNMAHLGIFENGCYADFVSVPSDRVHRLPNNLTDRAGALVEPLACAVNFIDKSQIKAGNSVVIIGGGSIGLLTLQVALAAGAGMVIVSEPIASKRELALKLGAHAVIDPISENVIERVQDLTSGKGADAVIECVGIPATVSQMIHLVRRAGRCVLAGIPSEAVSMDNLKDFVFGEVELVGGQASAWQFPRALRMIELGLINVEASLEKVVPFSEAINGLQEALENKEAGKMLIKHT